MSAPIRLYVDTWGKQLVAGFRSMTPVLLADLFIGNVLTFRVHLLEPNPATAGSHPNPFSYVDNSDLGLTVAIVNPDNTATPTTYASQNSWTKDSDNTYFEGDLALDGATLTGLLASVSSVQKTLEIAFTKGGYPTTVYQQLVTLKTRGITTGTLSVPATDTGLGRLEARNTYMPYVLPKGQSATIPSPSGVYGTVLYTDDNGNFHTDQITFNPPL